MALELQAVSRVVKGQVHIQPTTLTLEKGTMNVLLGPTLSGKTSLMRLMAGLDAPSAGRLIWHGKDVTGVRVQDRRVAMVYQQFINYPSLTVADNIASPLKLRGEKDMQVRVRELAERLHIEMFLDRLPAELSGGQQQRVALARALAKGAPLMLLDEPLVNLDYKLREELREELTQLFAAGQSTVVYATTEPAEALLLGGYTAVLDEGRLLQYGPTADVFHEPCSLRVARAFSDPPINLVAAVSAAQALRLPGGVDVVPRQPLAVPDSSNLTVGVRASALRVQARPGDVAVQGTVELAEISGSDTYVHATTSLGDLVAQITGVHYFDLGALVTLYFSPAQVYVFGGDGGLLLAPQRVGGV